MSESEKDEQQKSCAISAIKFHKIRKNGRHFVEKSIHYSVLSWVSRNIFQNVVRFR